MFVWNRDLILYSTLGTDVYTFVYEWIPENFLRKFLTASLTCATALKFYLQGLVEITRNNFFTS